MALTEPQQARADALMAVKFALSINTSTIEPGQLAYLAEWVLEDPDTIGLDVAIPDEDRDRIIRMVSAEVRNSVVVTAATDADTEPKPVDWETDQTVTAVIDCEGDQWVRIGDDVWEFGGDFWHTSAELISEYGPITPITTEES